MCYPLVARLILGLKNRVFVTRPPTNVSETGEIRGIEKWIKTVFFVLICKLKYTKMRKNALIGRSTAGFEKIMLGREK